MKVALVAYDDNDAENKNGPVNSDLFYQCWKQMGSPKTFFELARTTAPIVNFGYWDEAATCGIEIGRVHTTQNSITRPVN
jgi:hypothetical protein